MAWAGVVRVRACVCAYIVWVGVCVHCVGWRGRVAEYDLSLFLGDRYLCIDMGDGGVALGWCWLRLVANSNAEACCILPFCFEVVRGWVRSAGGRCGLRAAATAAGLAALLVTR